MSGVLPQRGIPFLPLTFLPLSGAKRIRGYGKKGIGYGVTRVRKGYPDTSLGYRGTGVQGNGYLPTLFTSPLFKAGYAVSYFFFVKRAEK